jgi:hypothetical protein
MKVKLLSLKSISKLSTVCGLTIALILGGANLTKAESRAEAINSITDWVFYSVNPQLKKRKLRSNEHGYIREWQRIRAALEPRVIPSAEACAAPLEPGDVEWEFSPINGESFNKTYDYLADVIFHSRHPERKGRKIRPDERAAVNEWSSIRRKIHISTCGI